MIFTDWSAKAVELRILEMADTLRMCPKVNGPKVYGNAMPETVKRYEESYGFDITRYRETASAGALGRMEQVWGWINSLPSPIDRKLLYAWSWVKVRHGMKISAFAAQNDLNDRTLRREITRLCQRIANDLNQIALVRLNSGDLQVSENQPDIAITTVSSGYRDHGATHWIAPDAKPQIDPDLPSERLIDHRKIRARHSDQNRSLGAR